MKQLLARFGKRARASRANERARKLDGLGRSSEAVAAYLQACRADPNWSVPEYNLGLLYKYQSNWQASLEHNLRATQLDATDPASWWNLGIAATALERWEVARSAWRGAGIAIPDGEGPLEYPCGTTPIRLDPNGDAEVVWARRIDPARAILRSIPLPDSGFRCGDVVLNDGAATGQRKLNGQDVPVFNCLALLRASQLSTWVAKVDLSAAAPGSDAVDLLEELARECELFVEDWSTSLQMLCKACSEGTAHTEHTHALAEPGPHRRIAIAAADARQTERLLEAWRARAGDVAVLELELVLDAAV